MISQDKIEEVKQSNDIVDIIGERLTLKKAGRNFKATLMTVSLGQIEYEWQHLLKKLENRDMNKFLEIKEEKTIIAHPLFQIVEGEIESWEKII